MKKLLLLAVLININAQDFPKPEAKKTEKSQQVTYVDTVYTSVSPVLSTPTDQARKVFDTTEVIKTNLQQYVYNRRRTSVVSVTDSLVSRNFGRSPLHILLPPISPVSLRSAPSTKLTSRLTPNLFTRAAKMPSNDKQKRGSAAEVLTADKDKLYNFSECFNQASPLVLPSDFLYEDEEYHEGFGQKNSMTPMFDPDDYVGEVNETPGLFELMGERQTSECFVDPLAISTGIDVEDDPKLLIHRALEKYIKEIVEKNLIMFTTKDKAESSIVALLEYMQSNFINLNDLPDFDEVEVLRQCKLQEAFSKVEKIRSSWEFVLKNVQKLKEVQGIKEDLAIRKTCLSFLEALRKDTQDMIVLLEIMRRNINAVILNEQTRIDTIKYINVIQTDLRIMHAYRIGLENERYNKPKVIDYAESALRKLVVVQNNVRKLSYSELGKKTAYTKIIERVASLSEVVPLDKSFETLREIYLEGVFVEKDTKFAGILLLCVAMPVEEALKLLRFEQKYHEVDKKLKFFNKSRHPYMDFRR